MWQARPFLYIRNSKPEYIPFAIEELDLKFRFTQITPKDKETMRMRIEVLDAAPERTYVVIQAIVFPGINLVWLGSILMMIGLLMGMFQKLSKTKTPKTKI